MVKTKLVFDENEAFPESEMFLDFLDENDKIHPEEVRQRVGKVLEQYAFEEVLEENDMSDEEALGLLYELGYVGLPELIEYEDEEVQDLQDEEEE